MESDRVFETIEDFIALFLLPFVFIGIPIVGIGIYFLVSLFCSELGEWTTKTFIKQEEELPLEDRIQIALQNYGEDENE
jgi:hypothetical protein